MAALAELGLADAVASAGCVIERTEFRSWRGELLGSLPVAELGRRVGQPSVVIRRGHLLEILAAGVGIERVHFNRRYLGFRQSQSAVYLAFEGGLRERADLLVGADGLHSAVRAQLLGIEQLRSTHQIAWVGMAPLSVPSIPAGVTMAIMGRGLRFAAAAVDDSETLWHATVPESGPGSERTQAELVALYRDGHAPMAELIAATPADALWRTAVHDRRPVERWGLGRVTIVGDAAHPMTQDVGQGACQGLEDAVVLARCIRGHADLATARAAYERCRRLRTARIAELSHATAVLGMIEHPSFCAARELGLSTILPAIAREQLAWMLDGEASA